MNWPISSAVKSKFLYDFISAKSKSWPEIKLEASQAIAACIGLYTTPSLISLQLDFQNGSNWIKFSRRYLQLSLGPLFTLNFDDINPDWSKSSKFKVKSGPRLNCKYLRLNLIQFDPFWKSNWRDIRDGVVYKPMHAAIAWLASNLILGQLFDLAHFSFFELRSAQTFVFKVT